MEYRTLGRTGVKVSRLCFGTMSFGGDADESTSASMFHRCLDAGINFFDTANAYGRGRSEEILGKLMAGHRDNLVISTKVYSAMGPDINERGLSRRHIMRQVEESLRRLQTDRIDLYHVHQFDADTPMEETLPRHGRPHPAGGTSLPRGEQLGRLANRQSLGDLCPRRAGTL